MVDEPFKCQACGYVGVHAVTAGKGNVVVSGAQEEGGAVPEYTCPNCGARNTFEAADPEESRLGITVVDEPDLSSTEFPGPTTEETINPVAAASAKARAKGGASR